MNSNYKIWKDAFISLRIPFSFFLMPVFWFAVSCANSSLNIENLILIFIILHLFIYPASNGYNSYYDKDEGSIGGLKNPPKVSKTLLKLVLIFDFIGLALCLKISIYFFVLILSYKLASKAYSFAPIRLKKYPYLSTFTVIFFQGIVIYLAVSSSITNTYTPDTTLYLQSIISSLFILGSYPLTQIYQHQEDQKRGDQTLSLKLGIIGTFIFSGIVLSFATVSLNIIYFWNQQFANMVIFNIGSFPILAYFVFWFIKTLKNKSEANYENHMYMNKIASISLTVIYLTQIIYRYLS